MYRILVAPSLANTLMNYTGKCAVDNGIECAEKLVASYGKAYGVLFELDFKGQGE